MKCPYNISEYESLRRTKTEQTNNKRFMDLVGFNKHPSMKSGQSSKNCCSTVFCRCLYKLGKEALIARKTCFIASLKDDFENIDDPISEVQKEQLQNLKKLNK